MDLKDKYIILTGAAGGIGQLLAQRLADRGAHLLLVERNAERVQQVCADINRFDAIAMAAVVDLSEPGVPQQVVDTAIREWGRIDMVINNAGIMDFALFDDLDPRRIQQTIEVNVTAPLLLVRAALPHMLAQNSGRIVNIGSAFGSIGFAHFATYCASKFAMRGFSEALRRELVDSQVGVTYVSPRATKTSLNDARTTQMLQETKTNMDAPEYVADQIIRAIELDRKEHFIGQPEGFFARLNGAFPRLVDNGLLANTRIARKYAKK